MEDNNSNVFFEVMGKLITDRFENPQMKLGQSDANLMYSRWQYERTFLDWFLWTTLYTQSWVFRNAVDKMSNAMVSDIQIESDAEPTEINNVIELYEHYKPDLKHLVRQAKIYGGSAAAMLMQETIGSSEEPLDIDRVKKGTKLTLFVRDRWQGLMWEETAGFEALGTPDFGKHKYYKFQITGDTGNKLDEIKFHYSHVLRCGNRPATQFTKYQLTGWDLPEGQHILDELTRDETTRASIASLVAKSLIEVVKMPGIRGLFSGISGDMGGANSASRTELANRVKAITDYRNFNNLAFLDQKDEYQQFQLSNMTGIADILIQQRKHVAGATEIPEMILYGNADKTGLIFQSDGTKTPELEVFQQTIDNQTDMNVRPIMDKLLPILWKIANGTEMPEGTTYQFLPVFRESQTQKLERAALVVNTARTLFDTGVFSEQDVAIEVRQHAKATGFGTNLTDEKISKLSDEPKPIQMRVTENKMIENPPGDKDKKDPDDKKPVRKQQKVNKNNTARQYKFERRGGKR